jgi:endonuclease/exonuclease/phosphatase family metal-dependent hydrolase
MSHTICTFNVNNLFVRYRFGQTFPGDRSGKSRVENPAFGYLPPLDPDLFELFNTTQRELAALALTESKTRFPDVIVLQEVESLLALREFNRLHLDHQYPNAVLIDSRDFRLIDVGVLSKLEILGVRTHVDDLDPDPVSPKIPYLFSRDCLEVEFALTPNPPTRLTLFVNHFKSKLAESAAERKRADKQRLHQAQAVRDIVHRRFPGAAFDTELFAVLGDLNDEPASAPLQPLVAGAGLEDALARIPNEPDRWTHWFKSENAVSQIDQVLLSPALAGETGGSLPRIERRGISFARVLTDGKPGPKLSHFHRTDIDPAPVPIDFRFPRFSGVNPEDYASDHCPVFFTVP